MIRILYIDDNESRQKQLNEYLRANFDATQIELIITDDIISGKKQLRKTKFHVLLIDVVLPLRSGDTPSASTSLRFLEEVFRRRKYKKPDKIVGITAFSNEAPAFEKKFRDKNFFFIETPFNSNIWLSAVHEHIRYSVESHEDIFNNSVILPVHGIESDGSWHLNLQSKLDKTDLSCDFFPYKFGIFSFLFFLIPIIRHHHTTLFTKKLKRVMEKNAGKRFVIIAHSFGTFLVAESLRRLVREQYDFSIDLVIFSGSVLKTSYPLQEISPRVNKIINDCGCSDFPLCLSQLFVLGTGMSGRIGFIEIIDDKIINRYFVGGHNLYFSDYCENDFIEQYWIPAILDSSQASFIDHRKESRLRKITDGIMTVFGAFKPLFYLILLVVFTSYYFNISFW